MKKRNIQEILYLRAEALARYKMLPYTGTIDVKEKDGRKYLYVRKRLAGKLTSEYVGPYDDVLYDRLLLYAKQGRELKKNIRRLEKELADLGYQSVEINPGLIKNLNFARANIKNSIYAQAILEGVATTFPQTEKIIDNGKITGMTATDVQKVLNLKHAWEFILDDDVILSPTDYAVLCRIAKLVNEGFFYDGGQLRNVPVAIGGTDYTPPLPEENEVKEQLCQILNSNNDRVGIGIKLCLWCMKAQLFNDGNKRTGIIFANHYLISNESGLLIVPEKEVNLFKDKLVKYYEGDLSDDLEIFLRKKCWHSYS